MSYCVEMKCTTPSNIRHQTVVPPRVMEIASNLAVMSSCRQVIQWPKRPRKSKSHDPEVVRWSIPIQNVDFQFANSNRLPEVSTLSKRDHDHPWIEVPTFHQLLSPAAVPNPLWHSRPPVSSGWQDDSIWFHDMLSQLLMPGIPGIPLTSAWIFCL